jgi:hypothetical protein
VPQGGRRDKETVVGSGRLQKGDETTCLDDDGRDGGGSGRVLDLDLVDLGGHVGDLCVVRASDGVPSDERKLS